jgi:hypothetical protein
VLAEYVIFTPTPEVAAYILHHLGSPTISFHDLATHCGTNAPALAAWMTRPEIQDHLASINSGAAIHARLAATTSLSAATGAIVKLLREYTAGRPIADPAADDETVTAAALKARLARLREHETARRAADLLYRIARFTPPSPRSPGRDAEAWRGGEGSVLGGTALRAVSTPSTPSSSNSAESSRSGSSGAAVSPAPTPLDLDAIAALLDQMGIPDLPEQTQPSGLARPGPAPTPAEPLPAEGALDEEIGNQSDARPEPETEESPGCSAPTSSAGTALISRPRLRRAPDTS